MRKPGDAVVAHQTALFAVHFLDGRTDRQRLSLSIDEDNGCRTHAVNRNSTSAPLPSRTAMRFSTISASVSVGNGSVSR